MTYTHEIFDLLIMQRGKHAGQVQMMSNGVKKNSFAAVVLFFVGFLSFLYSLLIRIEFFRMSSLSHTFCVNHFLCFILQYPPPTLLTSFVKSTKQCDCVKSDVVIVFYDLLLRLLVSIVAVRSWYSYPPISIVFVRHPQSHCTLSSLARNFVSLHQFSLFVSVCQRTNVIGYSTAANFERTVMRAINSGNIGSG